MASQYNNSHNPIRIGSRGSQLALWQANHILYALRDAGYHVGNHRVWRLCSTQRLWSVHFDKRGLNR